MPTIKSLQAVQLVQQKGDKQPAQGDVSLDHKSDDATPAPTPQLLRAIAFDVARDGSTVIPDPPPPPTPQAPPARRDPVLLELGAIELNAKIQFISLSDDPSATFDAGDVYELPITGYDEDNRTATVALNADMMKDKGLQPGERLVVRQVDANGNASDGIHVFLDPRGWASQNISQPDEAGTPQTVRGASLSYQVGLHGVQGAAHLGADPSRIAQTRTVIGVEVQDTFAPKVLAQNVRVVTYELGKKEREIADHLVNGPGVLSTIQSYLGSQLTLDGMKAALAQPGSHPFDAKTFSFFQALIDDPAMFDKLDVFDQGPNTKDGIIGVNDLQAAVAGARSTFLVIDRALEPGTSGTVRNNRTGAAVSFSLAADQRVSTFKLADLQNGDKVVVEYQDAAGNAGKPLDFEYSARAKDGKKTMNPLLAQIDAMVGDPLAPKPAPAADAAAPQ